MKKIAVNCFIICMLLGGYGLGLSEKFISPGFDESGFEDHLLFKDDTRKVRDQDFWPFSSYPMFSDGYHRPQVSRIEARGVLVDGQEEVLPISLVFHPLWENGLHRMLKKAAVHGKDYRAILDALARLHGERRRCAKSYLCDNKPKSLLERPFWRLANALVDNWDDFDYLDLDAIDWYVQLWDWETWIKFRKSHDSLHDWSDFEKSEFAPIYHKLLHSSELKGEQ